MKTSLRWIALAATATVAVGLCLARPPVRLAMLFAIMLQATLVISLLFEVGVALSPAGEILPLARKALADLDSVIGSSQQLKTLGRGRVSIAASSLQAALILPAMIRKFGQEHPGVKVTLHDVPQPDVLEMVRSGEVDFGIGTESGTRHDLAARVLTTDTFIAVMRPDHALARKKELTWRDFDGLPIIGSPPGNPLREQLDFALARLTGLIDRLLVYPANMQKNIDRLGGLIHSQRVLIALTKAGVAREDAYRLVQRNAMKVWGGESDFLALLKADPDVRKALSDKELEDNFDLDHHFKHVDTIFKRVFGTA